MGHKFVKNVAGAAILTAGVVLAAANGYEKAIASTAAAEISRGPNGVTSVSEVVGINLRGAQIAAAKDGAGAGVIIGGSWVGLAYLPRLLRKEGKASEAH